MRRRDFLKATGAFFVLRQLGSTSLLSAEAEDLARARPPSDLPFETPFSLPRWFDELRVSAHTRLSLSWKEKDPAVFYGAARMLRDGGFHEITRYVNGAGESSWWPSAVGKSQNISGSDNIIKKIIDSSHEIGQKFIGYYWHMANEAEAERHPEWKALDVRGRPVIKRGVILCLNSPYIEVLEKRIEELAQLGADGVYFDSFHMPKPICTCSYCRESFQKETGRSYPRKPDYKDRDFLLALRYRDIFLQRAFTRLTSRLKKVNPEAVVVLGSSTYPGLIDGSSSHRLYLLADSVKTEFELTTRRSHNRVFLRKKEWRQPRRDTRMAMGWVVCRDVAHGRPPHVWIPGLETAEEAEFAVAGVVSYGGVANVDVREKRIHAAEFKSAAELGHKIAKGLVGKRPYRWVGLYLDEEKRDRLLANDITLWQEFVYPLYGAFETLVRRRLPVGFVTKTELLQGSVTGVSALFLPDGNILNDAELTPAFSSLKEKGCVVFHNDTKWRWHMGEEGFRLAGKAFLDAVRKPLEVLPVLIKGGNERMHANVYHSENEKKWAVAICNDFSWIRREQQKGKADGWRMGAAPESLRPSPCCKVSISVRGMKIQGTVTELVTGRELKVTTAGGELQIGLPVFDVVAVVEFTAIPARKL